MEGGTAMYGSQFLKYHASWFGVDDLGEETTLIVDKMILSDDVVQSLSSKRPREAAMHIEEQLLHDPTNLLALRIAHDLHKRNGSVGHLTGSIPRVLPFWDGRHSGYRSLLGLHSASLVEGGIWSPAEEAGMRALSDINMPRTDDGTPSHDFVAINAICDLLYLQGRSREGLRFLRGEKFFFFFFLLCLFFFVCSSFSSSSSSNYLVADLVFVSPLFSFNCRNFY